MSAPSLQEIQDIIERSSPTSPGSTHNHKVFAKPFRLAFKRTETQDVTWIEVKTLDGLRKVCDMLAAGEVVPVDAFSTLDRQLWGHLAEHVGFLHYAGPGDVFSAGIQPAGSGFGELADDLTSIVGGTDSVLSVISTIRNQVMRDMESKQPYEEDNTNTYVKPDGINLTSEGERVLADISGETKTDVMSDIGFSLMRESEPGPSSAEMDDLAADPDSSLPPAASEDS